MSTEVKVVLVKVGIIMSEGIKEILFILNLKNRKKKNLTGFFFFN